MPAESKKKKYFCLFIGFGHPPHMPIAGLMAIVVYGVLLWCMSCFSPSQKSDLQMFVKRSE